MAGGSVMQLVIASAHKTRQGKFMKPSFRSGLTSGAILLASCASFAAPVTATHGGSPATLTGAHVATLSFSEYTQALLFEADSRITAEPGYGRASSSPDSQGTPLWRAISDMPLASLTYDDVTGDILSQTFAGRFTVSTGSDDFMSTGGQLSVTSLTIDLVNGLVLLGVENQEDRIAIWRWRQISGVTNVFRPGLSAWGPANGDVNAQPVLTIDASQLGLQLSALAFTDEGRAFFSQSQGYLEPGYDVMRELTDFGSITTAVPEASACSLLAFGLVTAVAANRRKKRLAPSTADV